MRRISFKLIPNFERYRIYSDGRVYDSQKEKFFNRYIVNKYSRVTLTGENGQKAFFVHRLVAQAFCYNDDPEHKTQVNHKIEGLEGKLNNNHWNLEWCSPKYNQNYGTINTRRSASMIGKNKGKKYGPMTDDHKAKLSDSNKDKHNYSDEQKAKRANKKYRNKFTGHITNTAGLSRMINQGKTTMNQWDLIEN